MKKRRTDYEIIEDLLKSIQRRGGKVKPTRLMYDTNLNYENLKRFVEELKSKGLIDEVREKQANFYTITEQGYKFVAELRKVKEVMEAFGL